MMAIRDPLTQIRYIAASWRHCCLVAKRFIIRLLNQQQKKPTGEKKEKRLVLLTFQGSFWAPNLFLGCAAIVWCLGCCMCVLQHSRAVVAFLNDVIHYTIPSECCCWTGRCPALQERERILVSFPLLTWCCRFICFASICVYATLAWVQRRKHTAARNQW